MLQGASGCFLCPAPNKLGAGLAMSIRLRQTSASGRKPTWTGIREERTGAPTSLNIVARNFDLASQHRDLTALAPLCPRAQRLMRLNERVQDSEMALGSA